jgi:hypothetical protein
VQRKKESFGSPFSFTKLLRISVSRRGRAIVNSATLIAQPSQHAAQTSKNEGFPPPYPPMKIHVKLSA